RLLLGARGVVCFSVLVCCLLLFAIALPCSMLLVNRIGWTVIAATVTLVVVILAKIPLIHPLLQALTSSRPLTGVLILGVTTSIAALVASFLAVSYVVRRRA